MARMVQEKALAKEAIMKEKQEQKDAERKAQALHDAEMKK